MLRVGSTPADSKRNEPDVLLTKEGILYMPQYDATVTMIQPLQPPAGATPENPGDSKTWVQLTTAAGDISNVYVRFDNPLYSSIFTLLMASAVNKKTVTVVVDDPTADEPTVLSIRMHW
jgi:hypothetical protein